MRGSALFADISGFTQLTEALRHALGPQRGAEALTAHLDRVFHALIAQLDRFGGNVIYFSGDAITAWVDEDDGRRAVAAALAMQKVMGEVGQIVTQSGAVVELQLKLAIAAGSARRSVVGDPEIQRIDVLAGRLLDELAAGEQLASQGEVVVSASVLANLADRIEVSQRRIEASVGRTYGVVAGLAIDVADVPAPEPPPLPSEVVRQWLLPVVYERLSTGRGEFLAELRAAYPMFVRFSGIDFDADDDAFDKLDAFVVGAQRIFDRHGGNVLQLTLGDKGAYLYGVFGSPIAHEDDGARAAAAALALLSLEQMTAAREIQIGIAHGPLRSGTYGHVLRRTFVCLGDAVNLSARLMSAAPAGGVYASDAVRAAAGDSFVWKALEPLQLKGKAQPVIAHSLTGSLEGMSRRRTRYELPIVGRSAELGHMDDAFAATTTGRSRALGIAAEAGLGKSRLVAEFVRDLRRRGTFVAFGECQAFGVNTSYFVWREIWRRLLDVNDDDDPAQQRAAAEAALQRIDQGLVARAPLLADVIGVSMPDSELTRSFDAKLRKSSLEDLLTICLRDRAGAEPIVLVLEDCHWIDGLSRELLETLVRASESRRVLFLLAYRPAVAPGGDLGLTSLPQFEELSLTALGAGDTRAVIAAKTEQVFGLASPPEALVELIASRAEGNPFYAEELLNYIAGRGVDPDDEAAVRDIQLPDSLHSLVLSRIDSLAENPRRTLKVASIIGRLFRAPMLPGVYPELGSLDDVLGRLDLLCEADLVALDQAENLAYLFRHGVTQEVSYNSMPFAVRAGLHRRVGEFLETSAGADLDPHLDLLAHHFWHGDDEVRKREYLLRAEASARRRYANATAIDYGERLVPLVDGAQRVDALLNLGKVFELTGNWSRAEEVVREALERADALTDRQLEARCETALAEVARKQGRYDEAIARLTRAADIFHDIDDAEGLGLALHVSGTVAAQQGDYDVARERYERSLTIRHDRAALASLYSNLAIIAEYQSDYAGARAACEQALAIRTEIGDRWGIGISQNNLGLIAILQKDYAEARTRLEAAIDLCREVGDAWMVALVHNNLGNAHRELGDEAAARAHYFASLEGYRAFDDKWGLTFLLEDIAVLAAGSTDGGMAFELLGAADALHDAIGSPRSPAHETELAAKLSAARALLGEAEVAAAMAKGKARSAAGAIELGLQFTG